MSVCIIISIDREGGNKNHKDLHVLPTPPQDTEKSREKKLLSVQKEPRACSFHVFLKSPHFFH